MLAPGQPFALADAVGSRFEAYDSLRQGLRALRDALERPEAGRVRASC